MSVTANKHLRSHHRPFDVCNTVPPCVSYDVCAHPLQRCLLQCFVNVHNLRDAIVTCCHPGTSSRISDKQILMRYLHIREYDFVMKVKLNMEMTGRTREQGTREQGPRVTLAPTDTRRKRTPASTKF